ncbi:hypothetical protein M011DRAFT_427601 [Sporormia fimetaria CBS 119925]|uniref:Ataxin-10 homolog n=1 Tax=Sporormia fimetaria CBS 119925 TaxID=1340428 RepID=A0A6A6V760_9PLEO|nr:hypothetical protein M011DRAFT_427601 [Sporormia fimetaria CBS 119925]
MDDHENDSVPTIKPWLTRLRLALGPYTVHFTHTGYIKDHTLGMLEYNVCRRTLEESRKNFALRREELGLSTEFWDEVSGVLKAAMPSLERRCFAAPDPATPEYEGLSGPLIASCSPSLLRDLERLNHLVAIARNVITCGEDAQNLAANRLFDKDIFNLINICVRVTARGYDGEAGTQEEGKWQEVINAYKKLLITCLQFLNNLVSRNESRKLMLWIELFDSYVDNELPNFADMKYKMDIPPQTEDDPNQKIEEIPPPRKAPPGPDAFKIPQQPASSPFLLYIGEIGNEVKKALAQNGEKTGATEIAAECRRRWQTMPEEEKIKWNMLYADVVAKYRDEITQSSVYKRVVDQHNKSQSGVQEFVQSISQLQMEVERRRQVQLEEARTEFLTREAKAPTQAQSEEEGKKASNEQTSESGAKWSSPAGESDFRVTYPPSYGLEILRSGKEDLLKRLEPEADRPGAPLTSELASPSSPPPEEDENDDEYDDIPGDEGRGLLTDVPLILGPTEIEVLPMLIMGGIVEPKEGQPGWDPDPKVMSSIRSMHGVRCHLLLAQDNGRNLLRELLIFVAAWDLREEELYFKFMVKIMEAILANQLLPFAYHAFRESESKDIISPAQAVIMKLLTNIFRQRQAQAAKDGTRAARTQVDQGDAHMVNFLLTEFRRHIIPQTCALIFLQGQIRAGHAQPEDFPLNLWDMERMYEGVYQYLEFFAILTEHEVWKNMLTNWEISTELVGLLKELDNSIPKGQLSVPPLTAAARSPSPRPAPPPQTYLPPALTPPNSSAEPPQPVAVERPYDVAAGATTPEGYISSPRPYIDEAQEEPSDFEWRNLKKLAVLVLSSLVWKNRTVQDQVRPLGGIEAILNCCSYDEYNPYIREHAIMCLRFLLEGNKENQDRIRLYERYYDEAEASRSTSGGANQHGQLAQRPKIKIPDEVLDHHGYETHMDKEGKVSLQKREVKPQVSTLGKGKGKETRDPRDLEQLVQQVMRELPKVQQGVRVDAEKAAALARLEKEFDGGK